MKLLLSIFTLYLLALSIMPCSDMNKDVKNHSLTVQHEGDSNSTDHDHGSTSPDLCSPFCSCDCCGTISGVVIQLNIYSFDDIVAPQTCVTVSHYTSKFFPSYSGDIWQPPKI